MTLRIHVLGPMRASVGEEPVRLPPRSKLPSLWGYLLVHRERPTPRTLLASTFWPDEPEAEARLNLRRHLHRLQQLLPPAASDRPWVLSDHSTLQWNPSAEVWLDAAEFERLAGAPDRLREAIELYDGDLLEGIYDDWVFAERERLRERCFLVLHQVIEQEERGRDYRQAILDGQRLLRLDPLREETYRILMRLHARSGDRAGVVRHFNACATVLERELGVEPSRETLRAYQEHLAEEVPGEAPPAEAGVPSRHNLPVQLTTFIGRRRELAEVESLLNKTRVLTLTGLGGVGKTRLALAVAEAVAARFADGVWWVDLAPLVDPSLLPQTVAAAIGLREQSTRPVATALVETLRSKDLLLVLDNSEHVVETCAGLIADLVASASRVRFLTTSTEPLGLPGEVVWPVPPLALPPAEPAGADDPEVDIEQAPSVRLFVDRATLALPTFRLTAANRSAVVQVCRELDGIPLALELAAARLKMLSVEQLVERLDDRFRLLAGGRRIGLPRHRTMQAVLDWSYGLLSEPERSLLRRLSLFVGGFTLESVEAVCTGNPVGAEVLLEVLSELVDKSMVTVSRAESGRVRYGLLETVAHYSRAQLIEAGEADEIRTRLTDYYVELVEQAGERLLRGPDQEKWFRIISQEYDNLRATMSRAEAAGEVEVLARIGGRLWPFWWTRGLVAEGRHLLEGLTPRRAMLEPALQAMVLHAAGRLMLLQGDYPPAGRALEESLEAYRLLGDQAAIAGALSSLGVVAGYQQDYDRAGRLWQEALGVYRSLEDRWGVARALNNLGDLSVYRGDYPVAVEHLQDSVAAFRDLKSTLGESIALINLGRAVFLLGDCDRAAGYFRDSLLIKIDLADREGIAWNLEGLAGVAAAQGRVERAARLFGAAEALRHAIGIPIATPDRPFYERNLAGARSRLSPAEWETAWARGAAMDLDDAVAYALHTPDLPAPSPAS